ncbi:SUKH-3 domain-containing protein [Paenibacillus peoriae]|uniref:SUKH-3 domain-containing protein n=1 Tax=Paenibacillus peoriae TaxID=59893 RepID=UPI001CC20D94
MRILTESGWYPGRKSDITETSDFLQSKGYQLFPCVGDVLSEFGGIKYSFNQPNGDKDSFQ